MARRAERSPAVRPAKVDPGRPSSGRGAAIVVGCSLLLAACQSCRRPFEGGDERASLEDAARPGQGGGVAAAFPEGEAAARSAVTVGPPEGPIRRLEPSSFRYLGAFRLPNEFAWGARGMTFHPGGGGGAGSLLITGFELPRTTGGQECSNRSNCRVFYGEVALPRPVVTRNFAGLPVARLLRPMTAFDGGLSASIDPSVTHVTDIEYVPRRGSQTEDRLYGLLSVWYAEGRVGENTFPTVWTSRLDGSSVAGLFHVGPRRPPFHGRKVGDYLFSVPQWYADRYLGGRTLVTGRARGTPVGARTEGTVAGGSQGPTLFAFHPFDTDAPTGEDLDAIPVLYYRVFFPSCGGPNVGDPNRCDYRGFTMCDIWTGGAFLQAGASQAVALLGLKGLGGNCYDEPPVQCQDPCSDHHGYHCHPYERQVIFYDVEELGRAAQGGVDPWTIAPYTIWRPRELLLSGHTCGDVGGMTFDPSTRRVFMIERGLGGPSENQAAVHVWTITE